MLSTYSLVYLTVALWYTLMAPHLLEFMVYFGTGIFYWSLGCGGQWRIYIVIWDGSIIYCKDVSFEYNLWELWGVVVHHYPLDQIPPNKWILYFIFGSVVGKKKILYLVSSSYITINLDTQLINTSMGLTMVYLGL